MTPGSRPGPKVALTAEPPSHPQYLPLLIAVNTLCNAHCMHYTGGSDRPCGPDTGDGFPSPMTVAAVLPPAAFPSCILHDPTNHWACSLGQPPQSLRPGEPRWAGAEGRGQPRSGDAMPVSSGNKKRAGDMLGVSSGWWPRVAPQGVGPAASASEPLNLRLEGFFKQSPPEGWATSSFTRTATQSTEGH